MAAISCSCRRSPSCSNPFAGCGRLRSIAVPLAGGPNFGYDLCVSGTSPQQRAGLDLSSWEVAYTGAERVQDRTLREFEAAFAPHHFTRDVFCPCYGLAETTLLATGSVKGEPVATVRLNAAALQQRRVEIVPPDSPSATDKPTCGDTRCQTH